ncbi:MAG: type II toxin-antitoxin system VapC family toxin [Thermoleophilia bacterium]|nr:type II toxin-antitoxin system VapC family toxin [Thermoleophilia bacterium]
MSFTFDANVLLYASDETSAHHARARAFLDRVASGDELVYLFWPTLMAYLRIATHPAIFERPLPPADAVGNVERLLSLPHVQTVGEHDRFWAAYRRVAAEADVRGNLVPDAHLVALMLENGVRTIWTHDRDYRRFPDIEARDPFD